DLSSSSVPGGADDGVVYGATWGANGDIVAATQAGLYVINASGGTPRQLQRTEASREIVRAAPSFLPDGRRFLYTVVLRGSGEQELETHVGDLDGRDLATVGKG